MLRMEPTLTDWTAKFCHRRKQFFSTAPAAARNSSTALNYSYGVLHAPEPLATTLHHADCLYAGYLSAAPTGCFFLLPAEADLPSLPEDFPSLLLATPSDFSAAAAFLYDWLR